MPRPILKMLTAIILSLSFLGCSVAGTHEETLLKARAAYDQGDYTTALWIYRELAGERFGAFKSSKGDDVAQLMLGLMYSLGQGVPQNYAEAVKWYGLAADQGNPDAQASLGILYHIGQGVPQNYAEAVKWYRLAAAQGNANAQAGLGFIYFLGQGLPRNYVRAHMWFSLSAAQGNQDGVKGRDMIAGLMSPAQVTAAQEQAARWRPRMPDEPVEDYQGEEIAPAPPPPEKSETAASSGTAFFVSSGGEALTNAHVVEGCRQIRVKGSTAQILARDIVNDLALLATGVHPAQHATWRFSVEQGEEIVAYGFPLAGVLSSGGNVVTGNVTALAGLRDDSRFLQISAPVQPGNSGGPLLDRKGNVVGVVVSKLNALRVASATGDVPQNVNFAVKASVAKAFLDAHHVGYTESSFSNLIPPLSTPEISAEAQAALAKT